eukprot:6465791-Prorocentrum_lima.AAC.1
MLTILSGMTLSEEIKLNQDHLREVHKDTSLHTLETRQAKENNNRMKLGFVKTMYACGIEMKHPGWCVKTQH